MLNICHKNKLRSKRGVTLPEVLIVVAIMIILLGIAVPNIFAEANALRFTHMNDNARAVAVAAQSKLYSMKNSGTSEGSEYDLFKTTASIKTEATIEGKSKSVYVASNFKDENYKVGDQSIEDTTVDLCKRYLLSDAITDLDLLNNGKIVIVYDPDTASILDVYYSEEEFNISELLSSADQEDYRRKHYIGKYEGKLAPTPEYKATLPHFSAEWVFDDEMYLQLTMIENPPAALLNEPLGLEVYARFPKLGEDRSDWDEMLIYAEGIFASDYKTTHAGTIKQDYGTLTLQKIMSNKKHLKFALDSLVTYKAGWGAAYPYLQHQTHPEITSMAEDLLYPREPVANWFNGTKNPYMTVFNREYHYLIENNKALSDKLWTPNAPVTDYIPVDKSMSLHVRLYVLSNTTREPGENSGGKLQAASTMYEPVNVSTENMSPYFYALSNKDNSVYISSMRDFNNLSYVFNDPTASKGITSAHLVHDISGQEFYDKLVKTRYDAIKKVADVYANTYVCPDCSYIWKGENPPTPKMCPNEHKNSKGETIQVALEKAIDDLMDKWKYSANIDAIGIEPLIISSRSTNFTIDGKKSSEEGGGNYVISNVEGGARNSMPGGFFYYAENVTFSNIDIINPRSWRNNYTKDFIKKDDAGKIIDINLGWNSVASGSLVGIAVNCQFDNVHAYIDYSQPLKVESKDGGLNGDLDEGNKIPQNLPDRRVEGTIVGGLVGIAVGGTNPDVPYADTDKTSFNDCSASALLTTGLYYAPSQCVYAGGLVGMAFGNVEIVNSYAASVLNGYCSGGLVGVATNGTWAYNNGHDIFRGNNQHNNAEGTLTITDSFATGHISRLTRIGGGLIACIDYRDNNTPNVSGCYSAVNWDALPPVAYGTFPGDTKNYYVSQTDLSLPITANVEAHFKVTEGDVIAQNDKIKSGTPCTAEGLKSQFAWGNGASTTSRWRYYNATNDLTNTEKNEKYPFPMRGSNNKFWGDWIIDYNETGNVDSKNLTTNFDSYDCPSYNYPLDWGEFKIHVDTGRIEPKTIHLWVDRDWYWPDKIPPDAKFNDNDPVLVGGFQTTDKAIQASVEENLKKSTGGSESFSYWALGAIGTKGKLIQENPETYQRERTLYGQGIDGATSVTLKGPNYLICGARFYDPDYDPIEGYGFTPEGDEINLGESQLSWDYYGFYCTAKFGEDNDNHDTSKYYIKFDSDMEGTNAKIQDGYLHVNGDEFKKALKYYNYNDESFLLPVHPADLKLVWEDGYFQVKNKNEA